MESGKRRFVDTSDEEIEQKRLKMSADKTIKQNIAAATIFREYLKVKKMDPGFEQYDTLKLDEVLGHFYMDVRKADGNRYKTNSLQCLRYSLNRYLKAPPYNKKIDIVNDESFSASRENFKAAMAELKRMGLGDVEYYPSIDEADRRKMYTSIYLSPNTPFGLQNKVQFDIRLYFCRRGMENMPQMTKSTFSVKKDPKTGLKYVVKTLDELTKNHRSSDKEKTSGIMPENSGSEYCPVSSFEKYVNKLNPECDKLWQRPKDQFWEEDPSWYYNIPVGEKTLGNFMSYLSKKRCNAQIMAVTGHKSVASLSLYQRVDNDDKIRMGQTLTESITEPSKALALTAGETSSNIRALPSSSCTVPPKTLAIASSTFLPLPNITTASTTLMSTERSSVTYNVGQKTLYTSAKEHKAPPLPFSGPLPCLQLHNRTILFIKKNDFIFRRRTNLIVYKHIFIYRLV
ncbi:KCTD1_15 [Mytilus edulis]|uniref:KCTD1_15 n=1 Tax=Mytilus edulis TaxID=6550 RepID=A0A8S3SY19_MYTED|nr:KCTD1_15 [Mytilus edulis]